MQQLGADSAFIQSVHINSDRFWQKLCIGLPGRFIQPVGGTTTSRSWGKQQLSLLGSKCQHADRGYVHTRFRPTTKPLHSALGQQQSLRRDSSGHGPVQSAVCGGLELQFPHGSCSPGIGKPLCSPGAQSAGKQPHRAQYRRVRRMGLYAANPQPCGEPVECFHRTRNRVSKAPAEPQLELRGTHGANPSRAGRADAAGGSRPLPQQPHRPSAERTGRDVSFNGLTGSLPPQWVKFLIADPASFRGNPGLRMQYDTDNVCMEGLGEGGGRRLKLSERVLVAVGVGVGVVGVASWALAVLAALRFRRRKKPQVEPNIMPEEIITTQNLTKEPLPLTFEQILSAKENMSGTQIIGKGGHGVVFRVKCPSDYHRPFIAVKKIQFEDVKPTMLHKSFWSEVDTVGQARHRNLVRLLGFVKRDRVGLLVYDYVSNGDLFSALHDRNGSLPWRARFGIARDVARGLAYLHHDYDAPIVHRDIKSSNVLLDDHLEAYISDFGVAKVLDTLSGPKSDQLSATMSVVGTCGYIAPGECALSVIACPCSS